MTSFTQQYGFCNKGSDIQTIYICKTGSIPQHFATLKD